MSSLVKRRPSPAMVVAVIALFVALGGVSYGLAVGSVGSREIRNNSVRSVDVRDASLLAKDFKAGQLPAGAKGEQGPRGPSDAVGLGDATSLELQSGSPPPAIGELSLPAGSYAIFARVVISGAAVNANYAAECELRADSNTDHASVNDVSPAAAAGAVPLTLSVVHTFTAPGKAVVGCADTQSQPALRGNLQITAIRVERAVGIVATA